MKLSEEVAILKKEIVRLNLKIYKLNQSVKQIRKVLNDNQIGKKPAKKHAMVSRYENQIRMRNLLMQDG